MKLRFRETIRLIPEVEIVPTGEFDMLDANISIRFFIYDEEGMLKYEPYILPNVGFGRSGITPKDSLIWGECFQIASQIASRAMPNYISPEHKEAIIEAWARVDIIKEANGC